MKKYWWLFVIAAPALAVCMAGILVYYNMNIWKYEGSNIVFEVKQGEGFSRINGRLYKEGLISNPKIFHRYAQINKLMTKFKAGKFKILKGSNMMDVFDVLLKGKSIAENITIPEGKNLFEIAKVLKTKGIIKSISEFESLAKSSTFSQKLKINGERVEGYLYPDTYQFTKNSDPDSIIKTMVKVFKEKTKMLDFSSAPLGLTPHQVIILASVVEKETGAAFERPRIAGVFLNRLKKKMRLQSDPTTIYGIYEQFNGNLRKKHLLEKTPYNTYKISGLPVGPIANPGIASIKAVLNPESHNFLYFVSQNDGTHKFSKTYREHRDAVEVYQKNASARRGKSWRDLNKRKQ